MARRVYTDFDITLRAAGAEYEASVTSATGSASNTFPLPFSDRELDDFFSMFGGRRVRRMETPQLERARALGGRLYRAVFNEELDELLAASLTQAGESGNGLRIRLRLDEAPDLVNIPWEYLYRPASDDFFALSNWTPIIRFLDIDARMPPAPIEPPLRILVMISDPIEYQGSLDVEREWERVQESLADLVTAGHVELHRLQRATERELLGELRRNDHHIFHFVGHGEFNEQEQDGVLLLEDEHRRTKLVTGRALGTILRDSRSMRLVVLNNCEGARASDTDPFSGAAQSLIQKGIPAVAAMQFEITDNAAISFTHEFYAGLSDGYPADAALAEARKAIYQGATKFEFGSPVLYLSAADGVIFNITKRATPKEDVLPAEVEPPIETVPELPPVEPAAPLATIETEVAPTSSFTAEDVDPAGGADVPTVVMDTVETRGKPRLALVVVGVLAAIAIAVVGFVATRGGTDTAPTTAAPTTAPPTTATTSAGQASTTTAVTTTGAPVGVIPTLAEPPTVADLALVPPTIDGSDAEWTARFLYASEHKVFGAATIDSDRDLSGSWRVAWDPEFLYLFAAVNDDVISQVNTGASLFRGDEVAIYFDSDLADDAPGAQLSEDDFSFYFAPDAGENWVRLVPGSDGAAFVSAGALTSDPELRVATEFTDDGYNIEARVPWRLLGVSDPQAGQRFRMTLDVNDNDRPGEAAQEAMRSNSIGRTAANQAFPEVWELMVLDEG